MTAEHIAHFREQIRLDLLRRFRREYFPEAVQLRIRRQSPLIVSDKRLERVDPAAALQFEQDHTVKMPVEIHVHQLLDRRPYRIDKRIACIEFTLELKRFAEIELFAAHRSCDIKHLRHNAPVILHLRRVVHDENVIDAL